MKKTSILITAILLGGCAMGINHNVATINGKQYLVETKTFMAPFNVSQWSAPSTFISLEGDIDEKIAIQKMEKIVRHCKAKSESSKQMAKKTYDHEKFYDCLTSSIENEQ